MARSTWLLLFRAVLCLVVALQSCQASRLRHRSQSFGRQIPGVVDTMQMAAQHMMGNNLQSPDAAADLSNTVLSEKFRSRYRPRLHCPVNTGGDWLKAQQAGIDILLSGNTQFSTACLKDAFDMYFNKLKKSQTDLWKASAGSHAQHMVNMWGKFTKKVEEFRKKGDRLAGEKGQLSDNEAKHSQLQLLKMLQNHGFNNDAPKLKHIAAEQHIARNTKTLRELRDIQEKKSIARHVAFENFKQGRSYQVHQEEKKNVQQGQLGHHKTGSINVDESQNVNSQQNVSGISESSDQTSNLSSDNFSLEDQFEMLRKAAARNTTTPAS